MKNCLTRSEKDHMSTDTSPLEELQQERNFAERLIETAQFIILVLDSEGHILRFNQYFAELSGYRLEEVQGKDWFATFIPEAKRDHVHEIFLEVLRTHRLRNVNSILLRDGQLREIDWSVKLLASSNSEKVQILAIGQDVTEREHAQAALRNLIDTTQDAVVTIDRHGHIELFNAAAERIFGYTRKEVMGQKVQLLMPEPYAGEHQGYVDRYEQTGEQRAIGRIRTVAAQRKNGQVFPIELSVTEIRSGNEVRYGAFIRDISEKVRLQEQLVERERLAAIGTTAATFAHEVGNPLNSMYMLAQVLERRLRKQYGAVEETVLTPLHNLTSEMQRLLALLEEFRSLARRQQLQLKPVSLPLLIADLCTVAAPYHAAHNIKVAHEISPDLPLIEADAEKLKQVLLNLCKNAVEAMPQGGTLTLRAHNSGGCIRLEVSDTGIGIPAGLDIFEPFATTKTQGTGLGLTIVRQIIAAHKGTLNYSTIPEQGSTFTIDLPLTQSARS
jgi:two-component system sensor kinase FixL